MSRMEWSLIKKERDDFPTIEKIMAICIGLYIPPEVSENLLNLAAHPLWPHSKRLYAYKRALAEYRGDIYGYNDFLRERGYKTLGYSEEGS